MMDRFLSGWLLPLFLGPCSLLVAGENKPSPYPPTRAENVVDKIHGVEVADPYRWLEDADNPEVKEWVAKQNSYTRSILDDLPGRDKIRQRLSTLLDIGILNTPKPAR